MAPNADAEEAERMGSRGLRCVAKIASAGAPIVTREIGNRRAAVA